MLGRRAVYFDRVRDIYDQLSPSYRRIADVVITHYRDVAFMTAAELGRAAQADTTSVVRFAQRLGYPGFPELIDEIKRDLRAIYEPASALASPGAVYQNSLIADRNNLDYVIRHDDTAEIDKVVEILSKAGRILVVGESAVSSIADIMALRLASLGLNAWAMGGDMLARIALTVQIEPGDAIIGIAPTAAAAGVAVTLQVAQERGAHTIAIVGSATNRAARAAQYQIYAPSNAQGLLYSPATIAAIVHALVQAVALTKSEMSAEWAMRAEQSMRLFIEGMREEPSVTMHEIISQVNAATPRGGKDQPPAPTGER
jgi:DNA-binding MurR/RpiR family transcriptional regulator